MLASKVEDMINTVVRQIAFYTFERKIHAARREGELTSDDLCRFWMEVQGESLGPSIRLAEGYETFWVYISHFIHSPFYVYAYAFGDCLVNSLYGVYQNAAEGFQERYSALLSAGGSKPYGELLAPFAAPEPEVFTSPAEHYRLRAEFRLWHHEGRIDYAMFDSADPKQPILLETFPAAAEPIAKLMPRTDSQPATWVSYIVTSVNGRVRITSSGRSTALANPRSSAEIISDPVLEKRMPLKSRLATQSESEVIPH